ncbi:AAA family ATPase [Microbacterium amylolyticum]|uniref:MinD-like ATPase involved in chromosome partitioning or flagellar assembly n=1 Tax=Microbacterium amylolyticum TaxID=936337 RepID=A0ABS4ZJZ2_9MICO|nr:CpsD/CapB family tyrosine-protein kinase [Microbacterium amylolyticum]MBP2437608.1 MinD-like ATPase involved in chromosome partitioning or flagellar assembly [Microbacterium amylolyticum]
MTTIVAADEPHGSRIARDLSAEGIDVAGLLRPHDMVQAVADAASRTREMLRDAETIVLHTTRAVLVPDVVALCDRNAVRIVPVAARAAESRAAASFGLDRAHDIDGDAAEIAAAIVTGGDLPRDVSDGGQQRGAITVVWGPHGAPGRTTLAMAIAASRAMGGVRTAIVDADTHAPAVAQRLGLADDAPGFPAACRQTDYGVLDGPELTRLSVPVEIGRQPLEVLTGINRPSRWPELSARRVHAALDTARSWCDDVIVDVAAPLESSEEVLSDADAPSRNAATLAALAAADRVVAVASADAVGLARFVRGVTQIQEIAPTATIIPVVNHLRRGALGVDGKSQARRLLGRFAALDQIAFLPHDMRTADRALLDARPVLSPRRGSPLAQGIRGLAATL